MERTFPLPQQRCSAFGSAGFTLVELMIVVVVIGILSAVAYPNYTEYVRKGHRAEARAGLLQAAQWMERAATATGKYPKKLPSTLEDVPGGRYTIKVEDVDGDGATYTLKAKPAPGTDQKNDKCGTFTLTYNGQQGVEGEGDKLSAEQCWVR